MWCRLAQIEGDSMIKHILKDGTEVPDIDGHVIKADQFEVLYEVINRIQEKEQKHETV